VRQLARELAVEDCVEFTGRIPDAALWEIVSTADVCVNPDRANEMNDKSTMNKILEYMALGKPIVQFDLTEGRFSAGEASLYARPQHPTELHQPMRRARAADSPARAAGRGATLPLLNRFALRRIRSSRRYAVKIIIERDICTWQFSSLPCKWRRCQRPPRGQWAQRSRGRSEQCQGGFPTSRREPDRGARARGTHRRGVGGRGAGRRLRLREGRRSGC